MHLEAGSNGVYTYKWYRSSGELIEETPGSDYVTVDSLQAGNYTCRILTPDCDTTVHFAIETFAGVELTISNDTLIAAGQSVVLSASGASLYQWQPEQWLDDPRSANPKATPEAPITYTVTGYNEDGCKASKSVRININEAVFVPNAFSPNGDGINDEFKIGNYGYLKLEEFRIFNRWGNEVFYTTDPGKGWTGNYNGKQADIGTYHYYIRIFNPKGEVQTLKGTLTLIY
jgi:gliding motility-associated-like protein